MARRCRLEATTDPLDPTGRGAGSFIAMSTDPPSGYAMAPSSMGVTVRSFRPNTKGQLVRTHVTAYPAPPATTERWWIIGVP